jgi:hypothetical protein
VLYIYVTKLNAYAYVNMFLSHMFPHSRSLDSYRYHTQQGKSVSIDFVFIKVISYLRNGYHVNKNYINCIFMKYNLTDNPKYRCIVVKITELRKLKVYPKNKTTA